MNTTTKLFKNRFDISEIHDLNDVTDGIMTILGRAETTLLLLTDLAECTGQGETREIAAIYSAIFEINDAQNLMTAYHDAIKNKSTATPNTDSAAKVAQFVARLRDYANDLEQQGGAIE